MFKMCAFCGLTINPLLHLVILVKNYDNFRLFKKYYSEYLKGVFRICQLKMHKFRTNILQNQE